MIDFVGTRWYKCDFHLHTMKSDCYKEKTDSEEQWIEQVKLNGLNCIAVTDHNDYRAIDKMKELGEKNGIVVFPGVEVTCDSTKIHILVIFDSNKTSDVVRDYLSKIDIDSEVVGKSVGTSTGIFEACTIAKERGALVIAAHIDEFAGINSMSVANVEKILDRKYIDAVQVVNQQIWEEYNVNKNKEEMLVSLNNKYGSEISTDTAENWKKTYNRAIKAKIPILSFSDNPCSNVESKHGLWGIGKTYTWIKMDKKPDLESVRQALLSEDMRLKLKEQTELIPEAKPDMWIKSIKVENATINPYKELNVEFNPQLNAIIGGRGSGKSSIIRIMAGGLSSLNTYALDEIKKEQDKFYKVHNNKDDTGIFESKSNVEIIIVRNELLYKVNVNSIKDMSDQIQSIYKYDENTNTWEEIVDSNYLDFFRVQVYTQKQIFEIAKEPDALLKIIDADIPEMESVLNKQQIVYDNLLAKMAEIRTTQAIIDKEGKLRTELSDYDEQISQYKKSGIAEIVNHKQQYLQEEKTLNNFLSKISIVAEELDSATLSAKIPEVDATELENATELFELIKQGKENVIKNIELIKNSISDIREQKEKILVEVDKSDWNAKKMATDLAYDEACAKLHESGIQINKLDELLELKKKKQEELDTVEKAKEGLKKLRSEKQEIHIEYDSYFTTIRTLRVNFIETVIGNQDNVKIELLNHGNTDSFEETIKNITQKRESSNINEDISTLKSTVFGKKDINYFRELITRIKDGIDEKEVSGYFRKAIRGLDDVQFDKMITFLPKDELKVSYKPEGGRSFIPLSSASAGQKTTAILTFILAYGNRPLLLDQPEDDLDNRLVYDLVVKRLKSAKQNRQIIVVTHNANIPVNGDAEYITSMDSDSRYVKIKAEGTLDNEVIRKEICDVMEGTEYAFGMRAKKYHLNIVE
ncbi:TrlF family AAA-like ATPase [Konateibacter massiliensis]|uniref:TrlF family AAA-like ATPase n=1 Tax=Konateibacter massiliensis TaxID=2002841 RepID=UPI000C147B8D|nr:AAA family ATPase [Konateibacter massiliensis]